MNQDPNIWKDVFSPIAQVTAFFGGVGGLTKAFVLRLNWIETIRVVSVGAMAAFGLGVVSPYVLKWVVPDLPPDIGGTLGILSASAYAIGITAVAVVERIIARTHGGENAGQNPQG